MNTDADKDNLLVQTVTSTEMQNNFGKYAELVSRGQVIIVTRNGKEIGRFVPQRHYFEFMTDKLRGILKGDYDYDKLREEELKKKYEADD